jgi:hypothetical protein
LSVRRPFRRYQQVRIDILRIDLKRPLGFADRACGILCAQKDICLQCMQRRVRLIAVICNLKQLGGGFRGPSSNHDAGELDA